MTTEERVREAAVRLFAERGFHGTGIRDLAQAAGLSSATLYHYMGTKEDLLVSIMRTSLTELITQAEAIAARAANETDRLVALVEMHVQAHAEKPRETAVVDGEMRALTGDRRAEIVALRDRYEQIWQDAIVDGVQAGRLNVTEPSVARLALLEMCSGVSRWYSPDGPLKLTDLTIQYGAMALGMLGAAR
ncbi:TetR/AcrR family transcriptional regulator [Lentzea sp. JNUCC 0626]|uniref:TetR/AcrR family transcriptional regulator n=1 Tax=Lentzea sp. JNUCC 0626 TaxID=3367513 RepID=UPI0037479FAB